MNFKETFGKVTKYGSLVGKTVYKHRVGILRTAKIASGVGSIGYAVYKAPETMHQIEDAGVKKGTALTTSEKVAIVLKNEWPALALGLGFIGADIAIDISRSKEVKAVVQENTSLLGQIAELSNSYNMVNDLKNAVSKKFEEQNGKEALDEVTKPIVEKNVMQQYPQLRSEDPYVEKRARIELWNDVYQRTGDPDYKIQELFWAHNGQKILTCNYWVKECNKEAQRKYSMDGGSGFINAGEIAEMFGFQETDKDDLWVWRDRYEWIDIHTRVLDLDGVAVLELIIGSDPHFDGRQEFMYM